MEMAANTHKYAETSVGNIDWNNIIETNVDSRYQRSFNQAGFRQA